MLPLIALALAASVRLEPDPPLVLRHVNVIPMTTDTVLRDVTVVVQGGRIAAVGRRVAEPRGARVVEGRGRYVVPGLADMHTHLHSDGEMVHDSAGPAELGVILANGVTMARLMIGTPEHLVLRQGVAAGRILGPTLWVASPQLAGRPDEHTFLVTTAEQARAAVDSGAAQGYDFIKLTNFITPEVYEATIEEARRRGIRVVGHVDPRVGVARAVAAGEQIEHLDAFLEAVLADSAPSRTSLTQYEVFRGRNWESMDYVDDAKVDALARLVAASGAFVGPTQNVFNTAFGSGETDSAIHGRPDWDYWPARQRDFYMTARTRYWSPQMLQFRTEARRQRYVEVRNRFVRLIHQYGGTIMAGSDTPEWFFAYGFGLHAELAALVGAGLSPFAALQAATVVPARFLGQSSERGTIEAGKRADFVLLDANPLEDIRNTTRIAAVSANGRWLDRAALDGMLERGRRAIAAGNGGS